MQKIFPDARDYKTVTVKMAPERIAATERLLGEKLDPSEKAEFNFYEIVGAVRGKPLKIGTIMALAGKGEYGAIEVVIGVDDDGRIVGAYIQRSRERVSKALKSPAFLNQFVGKSKRDGFQVGQHIVPASAEAELASRIVASVVRKMLIFHAVLADDVSFVPYRCHNQTNPWLRTKEKRIMKVPVFLASIWGITFVGCSQQAHFGQPIPSRVPVAKLADILKDPASYKDREVLLEGTYGSYCCASDFSYREGLEGIVVAPSGFDSPKADRGHPIQIYGLVRLGKTPEEQEGGESEKEEEEFHHDAYIEAKGVQLK
jgi:hypothetical protein